jgi:hypothetical protein
LLFYMKYIGNIGSVWILLSTVCSFTLYLSAFVDQMIIEIGHDLTSR